MIETTVAMVIMAGLFVLFGAFRLADRRRACGGSCSGCAHDCEYYADDDPRGTEDVSPGGSRPLEGGVS